MGEGEVKKSGRISDIVYGWPLSCLLVASFGEPTLLVSAALRRLTECKANHYRRRSRGGGEAWRQWPPLLYLLLLLRQSSSLVRFRRQAAAVVTDTPAPRLVCIVRH